MGSLSPLDRDIACRDIVDGWSYNPYLIDLPFRFPVAALRRMESLRQHPERWRPKFYTIPLDYRVAIAAYDTLQTQLKVVPGTWIYGTSFSVLNGLVGDILIKGVDPDADSPLFSRHVNATNLNSNNTAHMQPTLEAEPRCILNRGLLNISIVNKSGVNMQCQLLLCCFEPMAGQGTRPANLIGSVLL